LEGDHFRTTAERYADRVEIVTAVGEGFVEAVEGDQESTAETEALVRKAVEPLVKAGADKIVLGCTHYPFLRDVIERVAGEGIEVIDSSEAVARRVATLLDEHNLRAEEGSEQSCRYITFADESYLELLMKKAK
jgi:glutamate racemase